MKSLFKIISGIGFVTALLGMGCMDSASIAIPVVMLFGGLAAFYFGLKMADSMNGGRS